MSFHSLELRGAKLFQLDNTLVHKVRSIKSTVGVEGHSDLDQSPHLNPTDTLRFFLIKVLEAMMSDFRMPGAREKMKMMSMWRLQTIGDTCNWAGQEG